MGMQIVSMHLPIWQALPGNLDSCYKAPFGPIILALRYQVSPHTSPMRTWVSLAAGGAALRTKESPVRKQHTIPQLLGFVLGEGDQPCCEFPMCCCWFVTKR